MEVALNDPAKFNDHMMLTNHFLALKFHMTCKSPVLTNDELYYSFEMQCTMG